MKSDDSKVRPDQGSAIRLMPLQYPLHWPIVALVALLCITFFPYLFGGKTFLPSDMIDTMTLPYKAHYGPPQAQNNYPFDGLAQTYAYKIETQEALKHGTLAYWNPHIISGYPEYAESMANNFDFLNILLLWFNPVDVIHWETVIELLIAGIGMLLLLRFFGISRMVNLLFASAYMLNSLFITSAMHRWTVASFCWIPFIVLMILRYFHYRKRQNLLFASIFLALSFLGGNLQTSFFAAFVVAIIVLFFRSEVAHDKFITRVGIILFIGIAAFALSAIMWLPTLELFYQTMFRGGSLNSSVVYSPYSIIQRILSVPLLGDFFLPGILGDPRIYSLKKVFGVDIIDFNGAIGFAASLFGFWGCVMFWKNRLLRPFIILVVLAIFLPIATPLFSFLYHRFFIVASFSFSVIGAVSLQLVLDKNEIRSTFTRFFKWVRILFAGLVLSLVAAEAYIAICYDQVLSKFTGFIAPKVSASAFGTGNESWMLGRIEKTLQYYSFGSMSLWMPVIGAATIIISLGYYLKGKLSGKYMLRIVFALSCLQLFIYARTWFPSLDQKEFPIFPSNTISDFLQRDSSGGRFFVWRDPAKDSYILPNNSSNIYHTNDAHGYESLMNRNMMLLYLKHQPIDSIDARLLGLGNVKYILTGKITSSSPYLRWVYSADSVNIYENMLCKPRAYFAYENSVVESDTVATNEMLNSGFDGSKALFTKTDSPPDLGTFIPGKNNIRFDRSENEEVDITAQTDSKGIFILTDTYYPGWKCYVNGVAKSIYRVNYSMRAVLLDAGESRITFRFEPDIFTAGISISGIALFMTLSSILFLGYKSRNRAKRKD